MGNGHTFFILSFFSSDISKNLLRTKEGHSVYQVLRELVGGMSLYTAKKRVSSVKRLKQNMVI